MVILQNRRKMIRMEFPQDQQRPTTLIWRPARAGLAHELLGHGYDSDQGITNHQKTSNGIPMSEVNAVNTENLVRKASNTPIRTTYDDKPIPHKLLQDPQQ